MKNNHKVYNTGLFPEMKLIDFDSISETMMEGYRRKDAKYERSKNSFEFEVENISSNLGLKLVPKRDVIPKSSAELTAAIEAIIFDLRNSVLEMDKDYQMEWLYNASPTIAKWYFTQGHFNQKIKEDLYHSLLDKKIMKRLVKISKESAEYSVPASFATIILDMALFFTKKDITEKQRDIINLSGVAGINLVKDTAAELTDVIPMSAQDISSLLVIIPSTDVFNDNMNNISHRVRMVITTLEEMAQSDDFVPSPSIVGKVLTALCTPRYLDRAAVAIASLAPTTSTNFVDDWVYGYFDYVAKNDFQRCQNMITLFMERSLIDDRRANNLSQGQFINREQQQLRRLIYHLAPEELKECMDVVYNDRKIPGHKKFYIQ